MISFDFYSTHYKVYIRLPCIITQRQTTVSFDITNVISSSDIQTPRLYKGSANCCERDRDSDIICLLHPSQTFHFCNQSLLAIFIPEHIWLKYYDYWSHLEKRLCTILFYYVLAIGLTWRRLRSYNFGSLPDMRLYDCYCHGWVHYILTMKTWY